MNLAPGVIFSTFTSDELILKHTLDNRESPDASPGITFVQKNFWWAYIRGGLYFGGLFLEGVLRLSLAKPNVRF